MQIVTNFDILSTISYRMNNFKIRKIEKFEKSKLVPTDHINKGIKVPTGG